MLIVLSGYSTQLKLFIPNSLIHKGQGISLAIELKERWTGKPSHLNLLRVHMLSNSLWVYMLLSDALPCWLWRARLGLRIFCNVSGFSTFDSGLYLICRVAYFEIHHKLLRMVKECLVVSKALLIHLQLACGILLHRWIYGSIATQVLQLVSIKFFQSLEVNVLSLNAWELFRPRAPHLASSTHPYHALLIDLSENF